MLNIADTLADWCREERHFVLATVVGVSGSAPLPPGTSLAVDADGTVVGNVSGGCVEAAVYQMCTELLAIGGPAVRTRFGYSDSDAFAVGLTCGGEIDILVRQVDSRTRSHLAAATCDWDQGRLAAIVQVTAGPVELLGRTLYVSVDGIHHGSMGDADIDRTVVARAVSMLRSGQAGQIDVGGPGCAEPLTVLVHTRPSRPRMLIFGAVDYAGALSRIGGFLGYRVTVCDARATFATPARFPHADEVIVDWPHRYLAATDIDDRTVICVLTHDPKFDIPLLETALRLPAGYIGAMGSRRTHEHRLELLRRTGLTPQELARLRSPIGLDIGAGTPEQTAVSIAAEIIADAHHGTGRSLTHTAGPIHRGAHSDAYRAPRRTVA